jgi:hypothetical protein
VKWVLGLLGAIAQNLAQVAFKLELATLMFLLLTGGKHARRFMMNSLATRIHAQSIATAIT